MIDSKCTRTLRLTLSRQMATLHLPCGKNVLLDVEDIPKIAGRQWFADKRGNTFYARSQGRSGEGRWVRMHHFIVGKPSDPALVIDHINRNGLDNRKSNLRIVTHKENMLNRSIGYPGAPATSEKRKRQGSGAPPGIFSGSDRKTWRAEVVVDGKRHRSRSFKSIEDARAAHRDMVMAHCPERAGFFGYE